MFLSRKFANTRSTKALRHYFVLAESQPTSATLLRSSMMTPIFLILITNKIYTMTIAINQWMSLFSTICNPCYSGTFDNKIVFWGEDILLEIFWYWYTTWTLYGYRGMCLEVGNIILRAVVPKTVISLFRDMISHNKVAWLQMIWYPRYLFYF